MVTNGTSIRDFYEGKSLLIFGSTSFVGKVLLEKLLRSCPTIDKIYCPVRRTTTTETLSDSFDELFTSKLFDRVRRNNVKFSEKLVPLDIEDLLLPPNNNSSSPSSSQSLPTTDDREAAPAQGGVCRLIQENVDICFYLANNSVDFAEQNLKVMVEENVMDLKATLSFLKTCTRLKSIAYLSSIYANIDSPYIDECVYPCPIDPHKLMDALSWMDKEMIELATPKLVGPKPNAFTFSHWLAETILAQEHVHLPPLSIVRVSMIGAAWKEPYAGWVEKSNGPSELFVAAGRGYLRSMKGDSSAILDIVPVDIPVNLLISAAWHKYVSSSTLSTSPSSSSQVETVTSTIETTATTTGNTTMTIYHCTSSNLNPFHWQEMGSCFTEYAKKTPYERAFRRPNLSITSHSLVHDSYVFFSHLIPAYLADMGLRLLGKKPRVVEIYKNIHKVLVGLETFTVRGEIRCSNESLNALRNLVTDMHEQHEFYFDVRALHWPTYIESYLIGTKRYVLNEDVHSLSGAQRHLSNLRNIRYATNTLILVLLWRIFISKRPTARNLWFFVLNFFVAKFVRFFKIGSTIVSNNNTS